MSISLRLGDDQQAAQQLDRLTGLEDARIDEPIVFDTGPAPLPKFRCCHMAHTSRSDRTTSMSTMGYATAPAHLA